MKISTVTVALNSANTIARTVESFLAQSHGDKELLLIDGGSSDRTVDIVRGFASPQIRILSEPDRGLYDAMNKGLAHFSGDAVGFLNSDDAYHDASALARLADGLRKADVVFGDLRMVQDHQTQRLVRHWKARGFARGAFRRGWMPPHPTFYLRRALVEAVGEFDLSYALAADYDFMLRALELHAPRVDYIAHPLVDFKTGGRGSGVRAILAANLECLRARRRHLGALPVDLAFVLKPLRKILQLRRG